MRLVTSIAAVLVFVIPTKAQSQYGLICSGDACRTLDQKAAARLVNAKSICMSGNSGFTYPKKNPPSPIREKIYWQDIDAAQGIAEYSYEALSDCSKADLIIKINLDLVSDSVSLVVTDSDSGETVFTEFRSIQDTRNDLIRAAQHFRDAVKATRLAAQEQQEREEEAEHERERRASLAEKSRQCQIEFDSLGQRVILYIDGPMPQELLNEITDHNSKCPNTVSPEKVKAAIKANEEKVKAAKKADEDARLAQQEAAQEKALREKRMAELEKAKTDAFTAFTQQIVSTPFVPPTEGWMSAAPLVGSFYIILPGRKWETNDCHFVWDGSKPALDCLGAGAGRSDYFSVQSNNRWYLLKSKWTGSGEYAGTVKDRGTTVCLRKAGCYRVLAEVRQVPKQLPAKFQVPTPGALTLTYTSDDVSFSYPQNWKMEEKKTNDNTVASVQVAAPEAHLASWVTHGLFTGHVTKSSPNPQTLDAAYDLFMKVQRQRGLVVGADKLTTVGNTQGKIASYTSPSVLDSGESGWIAVVKDKAQGYYWVMMFYPSNDDSNLYTQAFGQILKSFNFKE
jgi:hypothetical protein